MKISRRKVVLGASAVACLRPWASVAQDRLRIEITEGVVEPMPLAIPEFVAVSEGAAIMARQISQVVRDDLINTGLFREIPQEAHIGRIAAFDAQVQYSDWSVINAQALVTGGVAQSGDRIEVSFRLYDVFGQTAIGDGLKFDGTTRSWRRMAHKVADSVYSRLTGESPYFDSRVAYIAASGPKSARRKQLAIMDYDGQNSSFLTDGSYLVLTPRLSKSAGQILYTSYETGRPGIFLLKGSGERREILADAGQMTFAPRFSTDEQRAVLSVSSGTGSDIYVTDLNSGGLSRLTQTSSIDTAPCFSPDGGQIVFESDRAGSQQIYVMPSGGGEAKRISFGDGRYATPVWSPRGDRIAFTKIVGGRFHIGVMSPDGQNERLLTASYIDEGPTWSPNGRVIMFFRETAGDQGGPQIYSVDITGRNLRQVPTNGFASDPSWSGLLA
ncbi:Tol-Pal system beta propeller repeat protein TolB [Amaricoccus tamworthensis]|uniref:Tol-Pal system beta propeller repeat protein TolB n=1 Tax=Amaricoccus tamworthensis TaxID=57002 RepID=UPI003C7E0851